MTTIEKLFEKIEDIYGFLATDEQETMIELIQQAKSEWLLEELIKTKSLTEHLSQEERNEYFDLRIKELEETK